MPATPIDPLPPGAVIRLGTTRLRTTASAIAITPDGKTLRTAAGGRTIGRWDPETGRLLDEVHLKTPLSDRCWFSPDGRFAAIPEPAGGIGLYDAVTGERKQTVAVDDKSHMTIAVFSPDGRTLATAEYESKEGKGTGRVGLWPVDGGEPKWIAELPSYVNDLAFAPDGKRLYAAVDNHSVRCWDTATQGLWKNDHWAHVAVSPDGKTIATDTYQDGPLRLWDARPARRSQPSIPGSGPGRGRCRSAPTPDRRLRHQRRLTTLGRGHPQAPPSAGGYGPQLRVRPGQWVDLHPRPAA